MPQNSPNSSPKSRWSPIGDTSIEETYSSVCRNSVVSDKTINFTSEYNFETPRTILQTPIYPGSSTPDIRQTIQNASPGTAKSIAFNMYQSLKQHGLRDEIGRAFTRDRSAEEDSRRSEELLGMEYILRDGFVSYLRDVAKITPPIPQQVIKFSGISYAKKFEIPSNKYETFGNKVVGWFTGPFKKIFQSKNSTWINILKGIDGYIMPGSMTLLLGPPGCGKSTLLEILAGRARGDKNSHLQGVVMYNDKYASEVHLSRLVAYVSGQLNKYAASLLTSMTISSQTKKAFTRIYLKLIEPYLLLVHEL
ncbi:unnamed protein product [Coffea canephora]|uniref:ABC transporter domain-containing protein n=1 Tax=Coffea canephora TaxID=49390 RepID=A0A068V3U7_COFCA|nr:unnamed protein product [Coffea canephora]